YGVIDGRRLAHAEQILTDLAEESLQHGIGRSAAQSGGNEEVTTAREGPGLKRSIEGKRLRERRDLSARARVDNAAVGGIGHAARRLTRVRNRPSRNRRGHDGEEGRGVGARLE